MSEATTLEFSGPTFDGEPTKIREFDHVRIGVDGVCFFRDGDPDKPILFNGEEKLAMGIASRDFDTMQHLIFGFLGMDDKTVEVKFLERKPAYVLLKIVEIWM